MDMKITYLKITVLDLYPMPGTKNTFQHAIENE
jgi:hypothetical protein